MAKTYTLSEVTRLFGTDNKSIKRWIDIEKWDLEKQTTPYDKRVKYLTEEQVTHLAKVHGRAWPPRETPAETPAEKQPGVLALIEDRLAALEASSADKATIGSQIDDISRRIANLDSLVNRQLEQVTHALIAIKELHDRLTELEQAPARRRVITDELPELDAGLVAAADFASQHGINTGTVKSAWQSGRLPVVRGRWRGVQVALDAAGRQRFYDLYYQAASFQACPDCPHSTSETV